MSAAGASGGTSSVRDVAGRAAVAAAGSPSAAPRMSAGRAADGVSAMAGRVASAGAGGQNDVAVGGSAGVAMAGQSATAAGAGGAPAVMGGPCPAPPEACKVLPLGDSITFGIGFDGGYRVELFRKAISDGKTLTFTGSVANGPRMVEGMPFPRNNEGHSGWKIAQLQPLIPSPALEEVPHIVLLMIGTNDVAQNDALQAAPERLGALLDLLAEHAPEAWVFVATILPLGRSSSAVTTYNDAIPALVQERADAGKHVVLVDQFDGFPTSELGDGVHPNQQGYERMAGVWYEAIRDLLR